MPKREDLVVLSLLRHNRVAALHAVVSHETALAFHELCHANPACLHLTVRPGFCKQLPSALIPHRSSLQPGD